MPDRETTCSPTEAGRNAADCAVQNTAAPVVKSPAYEPAVVTILNSVLYGCAVVASSISAISVKPVPTLMVVVPSSCAMTATTKSLSVAVTTVSVGAVSNPALPVPAASKAAYAAPANSESAKFSPNDPVSPP